MNDIDQTKFDAAAPVEAMRRRCSLIIGSMRSDKYSAADTALYLNCRGYSTVRGKLFTASNVARILSKEAPADAGKN